MADIEQTLTTLLQPIAPVHPLSLPEKSTFPAIVYQRIGTEDIRTHDGNGYDKARMQLSIYATLYATCRSTALSVRNLLDMKGNSDIIFSYQDNRFDVKEVETGLFRVILDYVIWQ